MKELPILFNGPMVCATLDGSKTQTRRTKGLEFFSKPENDTEGWHCARVRDGVAYFYYRNSPQEREVPCPYGKPGDRLYVRETWAQPTTLDPGPTIYRADYPDCVPPDYIDVPPADEVVWRPSIHMPKALARINLEVTGLQVQRLQAISESDCRAEGCTGGHGSIPGYMYNATPDEHFRHIWKSTGGDWDGNPFVWVIEFRRVE